MKKLFGICLLFCILLLCASCNDVNEDYFYQLNHLLKDIEFHIAKVEENEIILYDSKNEVIEKIWFEQDNEGIHIAYIRKEGPRMFIVTNGSADDEQGVVFINDDSNKLLDGISTMQRLGGNCYQYDTSH